MINYLKDSEKYKPAKVKALLVAEAPPSHGKSHFYMPQALSDKKPIRSDMTLEATVFNHYFKTRPTSEDEYTDLLKRLKKKGIFLVYIYDEPVKVCDTPEGLKVIIDAVPKLRKKIKKRGINVDDSNIIFLMSRSNYKKLLKDEFPDAKFIQKVDFRMTHE